MSARRRGDGGLVWSDERGGSQRRGERRSADPSASPRARPRDAGARDGSVRVRRESKGRRGKTVTSIADVPLPEDELRGLAGELKRLCGSGGSVKDGVIEIQGDHRDALEEALRARGFRVKRAGG